MCVCDWSWRDAAASSLINGVSLNPATLSSSLTAPSVTSVKKRVSHKNKSFTFDVLTGIEVEKARVHVSRFDVKENS